MNIAVLASGASTIFRAILDANIRVELFLSDNDECAGLKMAEKAGVPRVIIPRAGKHNTSAREEMTKKVASELGKHRIELVVMAGYMTILSPVFFTWFGGRTLNIHPSLLPQFKGANAVRDALDAGAKVTGTTVHVATPDLDEGPVVEQRQVQILPADNVSSLHERIKEVERQLYPDVIRSIVEGAIDLQVIVSDHVARTLR